MKITAAATLLGCALLLAQTRPLRAQDSQASPPPTGAPILPSAPSLPPGVGPQGPRPGDIPGAPLPPRTGVPGAPGAPIFPSDANLPPGVGPQTSRPGPGDIPGAPMSPRTGIPGAPGAAGAPPMPPGLNQRLDQLPPMDVPQQRSVPQPSARVNLISFLDSTAPFVQGFDLVVMLIAGVFCWRARQAPGLTILTISCFVSAIILLGFFLFTTFQGHGTGPQTAYIVARILAPFELLLFAIGIILVARAHRS